MKFKHLSLISALALVLVLGACAPQAPANTVDAGLNGINVSGVGKVYINPDLAYVYIGVKSESDDVAKALDVRAGSVTTTLSKMEESNLIYRERDSSDSRIVNLSLTEKGQETLMKSRRYFEKRRKQINEALTEEERNQFIAVGEKLIAFLGDDS